jgi:SAM-dependent methyltransferase
MMSCQTDFVDTQASAVTLVSRHSRSLLRCPACGQHLSELPSGLACMNQVCSTVYPIVDGVPVLIDKSRSVFSIEDFVQRKPTFLRPRSSLRRTISAFLPNISNNVCARRNYGIFLDLLKAESSHPVVLVLGGSVLGEGLDAIVSDECVEFVDADVSWGPRTKIICDGHTLPFANQSFDGVIVQAVLEHVVDPYLCVGEIHRVLRSSGVVYAETPFIQQVHGGPYDFTRFTHSGHRRLFRMFECLASGACCGPGMALAWSLQYFILGFFASKLARTAVRGATRLLLFWLKYFDYYLAKQPQALDAASAFYFLGRKRDIALDDIELIHSFQGGNC